MNCDRYMWQISIKRFCSTDLRTSGVMVPFTSSWCNTLVCAGNGTTASLTLKCAICTHWFFPCAVVHQCVKHFAVSRPHQSFLSSYPCQKLSLPIATSQLILILPITGNVPTSVFRNSGSLLILVLPQVFPTATAEEPQRPPINSGNHQET